MADKYVAMIPGGGWRYRQDGPGLDSIELPIIGWALTGDGEVHAVADNGNGAIVHPWSQDDRHISLVPPS